MDQSERRTRIRANLGIEPISHGQVHTFQIAIPEPEKAISPERYQVLEDSLTEHKSNLVPLIVRRTEKYNEEEEYEVVHGTDWCIVAKALDIEKLWVWVFDMTDEQAAVAKAEMEQLVSLPKSDESDLESLLTQKLRPIMVKLGELTFIPPRNVQGSTSDDKLGIIENKLEQLASTVESLTAQVEKLLPVPKLNLLQAEEEEINRVLEDEGVAAKQRKAALEAIQYWRKTTAGLSWQNLKKSTKSGKDKIDSFGETTYQKLKVITDIQK